MIRVIVTQKTLARCPSPQFGQLGDLAIIRCHITVDFENISWYKEGIDDAIVTYGRKSRRDTSGEPEHDNDGYFLLIDGSLLIYEVGPERRNVQYTFELTDSHTVGRLSQSVEFIVINETAAEKSTATFSSTEKTKPPMQQITKCKGPFDIPIFITQWLVLVLTVLMLFLFCVSRKYTRKVHPQGPEGDVQVNPA